MPALLTISGKSTTCMLFCLITSKHNNNNNNNNNNNLIIIIINRTIIKHSLEINLVRKNNHQKVWDKRNRPMDDLKMHDDEKKK